jgi:hypothetical protein
LANANAETVLKTSREAALVFLPFRIQGLRLSDPWGASLERLLPHLPMTALVMAAEDIDLDAAPEEGAVGEAAEAQDTREERVKQADELAKKAQEAQQRLEALEKRLDSSTGLGETELDALQQEVAAAKEAADKEFRRAAKAQAKAKDAETAAAEATARSQGIRVEEERKIDRDP